MKGKQENGTRRKSVQKIRTSARMQQSGNRLLNKASVSRAQTPENKIIIKSSTK